MFFIVEINIIKKKNPPTRDKESHTSPWTTSPKRLGLDERLGLPF